MTSEERYPSYRAPQGNREVLCVPAWEAILETLPAAREHIASSEQTIFGVKLAELAKNARREAVAEALRYTSSYTSPSDEFSANAPLIITGHQPELVHPGVWLKNFTASRLAEQANGTAINLIIDSDLCRKPSIRVPTGAVAQPQVLEVAFDESLPEAPYESRNIHSVDTWTTFGERVAQTLAPVSANPMVSEWWPREPETENVGYAIARARHRQELSWGNQTLEVPQSSVCQSESFRRFAMHLLADASRVRDEYNGALADYRQAHRVRSSAQPLPDLQQSDQWIETPFWMWSDPSPVRRPLYVRTTLDSLILTDRHGWQEEMPVPQAGNVGTCLQRLAEWEASGHKLRTRALITTLYARLLLADTFIHGIGGAKYDQVTEQLCERIFGIRLAPMVVVSGTLRLPIEHESVASTRVAQLRQQLRDLRYHPETQLHFVEYKPSDRSQFADLVSAKQHWVQTAKTIDNAAERHAQIEDANLRLQPFLAALRSKIEAELSSTLSQNRANQLLESREYPFCLFPAQLLKDFLLDFWRQIP